MKSSFRFRWSTAVLAAFVPIAGMAAPVKREKLHIFVLAGQSNMVGHAHYITVPALLTSEEPVDASLAKLVFKEGVIVPDAARKQLEIRIKRDELNESLRNKTITGEDQIAAAKDAIAKLQADYDARSARIKDAFAVSERVY